MARGFKLISSRVVFLRFSSGAVGFIYISTQKKKKTEPDDGDEVEKTKQTLVYEALVR